MNSLEKKMITVLKRLKNDYGVIEVKAEYENEGSRQDELMRLKDVASVVGLPIIIKIGGVEAVSDIYKCLALGAKGIIAPMVETQFAASKFTNALDTFVADDNKDELECAINIETITAYENIDSILSLHNIDLLYGITVGRVDFTASMGKDRDFANGDEMLEYCTNIFKKARDKGLKCGLGGAVSAKSEEFIRSLVSQNLIDKYETRKVVYQKDAINTMTDGILVGVEFELLWLQSKRRYYHRIRDEDKRRIEMLSTRL